MGFLGRKPTTIQPIATHLDIAWHRAWVERIVRDSGVDPADEENGIALVTMAGMSTHGLGNNLMDNFNGAWAKPILAEYVQSDGATPWGMAEVIGGWNRDAVPAMEKNLNDFAEMLIEAGRENGEFRAPS